MRRDPKKAGTYRFNGHPYIHTGSIRPVTIAELESRIRTFEAKLADPGDADDRRWVERWWNRLGAESSRKLDGLSLKAEERSKSLSRRRGRPGRESPGA